MTRRLAFLVLVVAACGGESAEERICGAANGCGALATAGVDMCIDTLGTIDAERALSECADCLEAKTCAEINDGSCAPDCGPFASLFSGGGGGGGTLDRNKQLRDVTEPEADELCGYASAQVGGDNVTEACGDNVSANSGTVAQCVSHLLGVTCTVTIGQYQDCYAAVDSPCDFLTVAACQPLHNCP